MDWSSTTVNTPIVEPWVDAATIAEHLGFKEDHIRKLARAGIIPGSAIQNGSRVYWRFKISAVDLALETKPDPLIAGFVASIMSPIEDMAAKA